MESTMLNDLVNRTKEDSYSSKLYSYHFSLFHYLYKIKFKMGLNGYFLNIDTMRIRLIKVPDSGCRFYDEEQGNYCSSNETESGYCAVHSKYRNSQDLELDILTDFYLNKENIRFSENRIFQKLYKGFILYSLNSEKTKEAMKFFDIKNLDLKNLKKKYHGLAKKYHPDKGPGNSEKMKIINSHYQILSEILSL